MIEQFQPFKSRLESDKKIQYNLKKNIVLYVTYNDLYEKYSVSIHDENSCLFARTYNTFNKQVYKSIINILIDYEYEL